MNQKSQEKFYNITLDTIGEIAKLPIIKVNREEFLKQQFSESSDLSKILKEGPQALYSVEALQKIAHRIVIDSTNKTSAISFATGIPSNPLLMLPAGSADVVQYFGFAINMAQKIAYLFGEDNLFDSYKNEISEESKLRIIAYLGVMFGAAGSSILISKVSKQVGQHMGQKITAQALTKTTWYPLLKKVGAILGKKITKQSLGKTITKSVPIVGGVISGGITYVTFLPMGKRLINELSLNTTNERKTNNTSGYSFKKCQKNKNSNLIIDAEFTEL